MLVISLFCESCLGVRIPQIPYCLPTSEEMSPDPAHLSPASVSDVGVVAVAEIRHLLQPYMALNGAVIGERENRARLTLP